MQHFDDARRVSLRYTIQNTRILGFTPFTNPWMPVTAKLSSRFYERIGDEATTELVEWLNAVDTAMHTQLREFIDLKFDRFSAEIATRFAEQDARMERRFAAQDAKFEAKFMQLHTDIARVEVRLAWQMLGTFVTLIGVLLALSERFIRS